MVKYREIAKRYRISTASVIRLTNKVRKKSKFVEEMLSNQELKEEKRQLIKDTIEELNKEDGFIDSVGSLVQKLEEESDVIVKRQEVIDVMKKDLDMSFRKIRPTSLHANS